MKRSHHERQRESSQLLLNDALRVLRRGSDKAKRREIGDKRDWCPSNLSTKLPDTSDIGTLQLFREQKVYAEGSFKMRR